MLAVPSKESESARGDSRKIQPPGKVLTTSMKASGNSSTTLKRETAMPVSEPLKKNSKAILIQPEGANMASSVSATELRPIVSPPLQFIENTQCRREHAVPRPQSHSEGSRLLPRTKMTVKSNNLSKHRPMSHEDGVATPPKNLQEDTRRCLHQVFSAEEEGLMAQAVGLRLRDDREGAGPGEQRQHKGLSVQPSVTKTLHHPAD